MSSRAYAHLPELVGIDSPDAGVIRSSGESVFAPTTILATPDGTSFGPLFLGVPEQSVASISRMTFLPSEVDEDSGWLVFGVIGGTAMGLPLAAPDDRQPNLSRRQVLGLAGAVLGAAAVGAQRVSAASDDDDLVALKIAEFDLDESNGPLEVRVLDVVEEVLPSTTELLVDAEETRTGEIESPGQGVVLAPSITGTVEVYLQDAKGRLDRLLAWAKGSVDRDDEIVYARELDQPPTEYEEEAFITLSSHPAIVEPVRESEADGTQLAIGETTIPHQSEAATEVGSYGVFDGALVYQVGPNPPDATGWTLETRLGLLSRAVNRVED